MFFIVATSTLPFFAGKLIFTSLGSTLQALLVIPIILLIKYAFDDIIPQKNIDALILIGVVIFLLRLVNSMVSIWFRDIHIKIINDSIYRLRSDLYAKLYNLSRSFHTSHDQKIIQTRIVQDTERLLNLCSALISRVFPAMITSLALGIILVFLNWKLMLIILLLVPLIFLSNRYVGKYVKKRVFVFQRAFESFSKGVFFILRFMDLTVIQSNQRKEIENQQKVLEDLKIKTNKMAIIYTVNSQVQEIISSFIGIVIIVLGGIAVVNQSMTLGDFLSFYIAASFLNRYINSLTTAVPEIIAGNESLITLHELATNQHPGRHSGPAQSRGIEKELH